LYSQIGVASGEAETSYTLRTVSLANLAGQPTILRFNFAFTGGSYYPYSAPYVGWNLEQILVTNTLQITSQTTNVTASTNFTFTPSQAQTYVLYAEPVLFSQFPLTFGPPEQVAAIIPSGITMTDPVLSGNSVQLNFTVAGGLAGNYLLLQTTNARSAWTTNTSATFTTNTPGTSYRFTTTKSAQAEFYQIKLVP
jgi:hypothetical protein